MEKLNQLVEDLRNRYSFVIEINNSEIADFAKYVKSAEVQEAEVFYPAGSLDANIYIITKGLVRAFYTDKKNRQITTRLMTEYQLLAPYHPFLLGMPGKFSYQALEKCELLYFSKADIEDFIQKHPKFESTNVHFLKIILAETLDSLDNFLLLNPEQRYRKFIEEHPDLFNRVPSKYIANVLGITPVSLSRIRKRLTKRQP